MSSPYPLRTPRLTVRLMGSADRRAFTDYRNDPEVARHQLWDLPYSYEDSDYLADQDDTDDIGLGRWTTFAIEVAGTVVGDVCCQVDATGGVAEIGFTVARAHQGKGYATEAALPVVTDLVERIGVQRVYGELDPPNVASQRMLERLGLVFEAETRKSFRWRGEWCDNMSYAATSEEWRAWNARPTGPPADVRLVALTADRVHTYGALRTHHSQERFVAPMAVSYADALAPGKAGGSPATPWLRGIEADDVPVGFVMVAVAGPDRREPMLWRLLDRRDRAR